MRYSRAFFDLQLHFAQAVSRMSGLPLATALLRYTNFYIRFALGHGFDPAHPAWREYLAGLDDTHDPGEWTYRFYRSRPEAVDPPGVVATFGCFSYARSTEDRIRLHFGNAERDGPSPLALERRRARLGDLARLFEHVGAHIPGSLRVRGASWLYNLDAYRRLFPASYIATARVLEGRFQHMPLWGQFVDRHGEVKHAMRRPFLERLARQASIDALDRCFPFPVLTVEAPVESFYDFYGIRARPTRIPGAACSP